MRKSVLVLLASIAAAALVIAFVLIPHTQASTPNYDLDFRATERAPSCENPEGDLRVTNNDPNFYYRVVITGTAINKDVCSEERHRDCDDDGDCTGASNVCVDAPEDCSSASNCTNDIQCKFTLSGTKDIEPMGTEQLGSAMPTNCSGSCTDCDYHGTHPCNYRYNASDIFCLVFTAAKAEVIGYSEEGLLWTTVSPPVDLGTPVVTNLCE
jgi:hypothetical protein